MKYVLLMIEDETALAMRRDPDRAEAYWGAWSDYVAAVAASGLMVSGEGLAAPEAATTVRLQGGARTVQDGPFADSKEQLGGFFVIDAPDLDTALAWAARSPAAAQGCVEVRPALGDPEQVRADDRARASAG